MRKHKLCFIELSDLFSYVNSQRMVLEGEKGVLYKLEKTLTNNDKYMLLTHFSNVKFYNSQSQYAPEQKSNCIFLTDKIVR